MVLLRSLGSLVLVLACLSEADAAERLERDPALVLRHRPVEPFTFPCEPPGRCGVQAGPGPADRFVSPFEGTLGRPCGYRTRITPEGTRKVRMCF